MLNFAATENSSYLLCNATMLLARHPEWLEALWNEQRALMEEFGEDNFDRKVRLKQPSKLHASFFNLPA